MCNFIKNGAQAPFLAHYSRHPRIKTILALPLRTQRACDSPLYYCCAHKSSLDGYIPDYIGYTHFASSSERLASIVCNLYNNRIIRI